MKIPQVEPSDFRSPAYIRSACRIRYYNQAATITNRAGKMLDALESHEIIGLLCAAQCEGLIQGWKLLGPVILINRPDGNMYVPAVSATGFLQELNAKC